MSITAVNFGRLRSRSRENRSKDNEMGQQSPPTGPNKELSKEDVGRDVGRGTEASRSCSESCA
jgi:hypothetical protein